MGFTSHADAKLNHWFSRKHQTNEVHYANSTANAARLANKWAAAYARSAEASKRSPEEKLARLNSKFGKDVGAKRERARLTKAIADAKTRKAAPKPEAKKPTPKR